MPRATAAEAAETARRILETATGMFAEQGYAAASIDVIARGAGVTRGAVYHHFDSKPGLFEAVAASRQRQVANAIEAAADGRSPDASLRSGSHAFVDAITEARTARILLIDAPAVLSWESWRRMDEEGAVAHLTEALDAVGLTRALVGAAAAALSGAMNELALWLSERAGDADAREQAHETLDRLLDAVLPHPAGPESAASTAPRP